MYGADEKRTISIDYNITGIKMKALLGIIKLLPVTMFIRIF
jgi:hypothetical protein